MKELDIHNTDEDVLINIKEYIDKVNSGEASRAQLHGMNYIIDKNDNECVYVQVINTDAKYVRYKEYAISIMFQKKFANGGFGDATLLVKDTEVENSSNLRFLPISNYIDNEKDIKYSSALYVSKETFNRGLKTLRYLANELKDGYSGATFLIEAH